MKCCGCAACADICPKKCIEMAPDAYGFAYPEINEEQCINCGACKKVCPIYFEIEENQDNEISFACVSKNDDVLFNSSSGGAFTSIYKYFISQGYIVYGVKWGDNFQVLYDCSKTDEGCEQFRKSKYILSNTNHCFTTIEMQLKNQEKVLFTGTPCHCAALINYLNVRKVSRDNLFTVDIICHGAPSQKIFDDYIAESNISYKGRKIYTFRFKNKIPYCGFINSRTAEITYDDGSTEIVDAKTDAFLKGYYNRIFYRDSCLECRFANASRITDITIGDAWHIEELYPEWDSQGGISLVIVNTDRAKEICSDVFIGMNIKDVALQWAIEHNSNLHEPTKIHPKRELFFETYSNEGYYEAVSRAMKPSVSRIIKNGVKRLIKMGGVTAKNNLKCKYSKCPYYHYGVCLIRKVYLQLKKFYF